jgi:hypothetical protein
MDDLAILKRNMDSIAIFEIKTDNGKIGSFTLTPKTNMDQIQKETLFSLSAGALLAFLLAYFTPRQSIAIIQDMVRLYRHQSISLPPINDALRGITIEFWKYYDDWGIFVNDKKKLFASAKSADEGLRQLLLCWTDYVSRRISDNHYYAVWAIIGVTSINYLICIDEKTKEDPSINWTLDHQDKDFVYFTKASIIEMFSRYGISPKDHVDKDTGKPLVTLVSDHFDDLEKRLSSLIEKANLEK